MPHITSYMARLGLRTPRRIAVYVRCRGPIERNVNKCHEKESAFSRFCTHHTHTHTHTCVHVYWTYKSCLRGTAAVWLLPSNNVIVVVVRRCRHRRNRNKRFANKRRARILSAKLTESVFRRSREGSDIQGRPQKFFSKGRAKKQYTCHHKFCFFIKL